VAVPCISIIRVLCPGALIFVVPSYVWGLNFVYYIYYLFLKGMCKHFDIMYHFTIYWETSLPISEYFEVRLSDKI
jgi:hypothetical protein